MVSSIYVLFYFISEVFFFFFQAEDGIRDAQESRGLGDVYKRQNVFSGNFINGRYDGRGIMKWATGCRYEGQWRASRMHGDGRYTDATGTVWVGKFYNGVGPGLRPSMPTLLQ
eukprot:TRINITY_DN4123_c0_g1_i1.p1 TRINITY_DN4123_c0_g1~~TRINITY_DN4123_c0_g1_i1.p1  ORF type:complete len:113 (+),score=19.71 TRINITY_DN4123_c0_g1_i1:52-390(+)